MPSDRPNRTGGPHPSTPTGFSPVRGAGIHSAELYEVARYYDLAIPT
jgi:hypothetical protein